MNENREKVLQVKDLIISFKTDKGIVHAVRGVSFNLYKGETLCIVGESGSGKSVTNKAIMGISAKNARIEHGQILYEGEDLVRVSEEEFPRIRGHKIGMIFQDPLSALNPVMRIGKQITEATLTNRNILKRKYSELISKELDDTNFKLLDVSTIKNVADELKQKDKKIVFTNGCFDLLHAGHISSFEQAKKMGDILIVAVNSDKSVKDNKGDLRPIISEKDRIKMLCSLEVIDYVVLMDDKTPERLISIIQPDICVKGDDWKGKEIPEKKIIDSYGGELKFIELKKNLSTTKIIERILKVYEKK